jgi:hypothetical protein
VHFPAIAVTPTTERTVSIRCPVCGQNGTFATVAPALIVSPANVIVGLYKCPKESCHALVYVVLDGVSQQVVVAFPPEVIDFDATNLPTEIREALEEAITCHAHDCFVASAIMG